MEIPGVNKKRWNMDFPGVTKNIVEFPWGLGHWCLALEIPMPMAGCS